MKQSTKNKKYSNLFQEPNAEDAPKLGRYQLIPVVGTAQLGDNGLWCDLDYPVGYGDGFIKYPSKDPQAYAIRCVGDSMKPRIRNGEFVIVEPNSEVVIGNEVLVKSIDGRVMVKSLLFSSDDRIYLQSINDIYPSITLELKDIDVIHSIAAIAKSILWDKNP
jgi:phage repressor protein C with HTH and peptisase S24 domain